ncbi:hypothetical protein MPH_01865 [Macrophomina phaseolina MS6]|uniref:Uncharacterized protein n=1 Tax=Macrophomina phaseolina (strain MS6) TaxID=1126212 RepID=K2RE78_MACPH|nr:hypothetical protein MPH_01865 [Macrophomina phaseolina MS6]
MTGPPKRSSSSTTTPASRNGPLRSTPATPTRAPGTRSASTWPRCPAAPRTRPCSSTPSALPPSTSPPSWPRTRRRPMTAATPLPPITALLPKLPPASCGSSSPTTPACRIMMSGIRCVGLAVFWRPRGRMMNWRGMGVTRIFRSGWRRVMWILRCCGGACRSGGCGLRGSIRRVSWRWGR